MGVYEEESRSRLSLPKQKKLSNFDDVILHGLKQNKK